MQIKKVYSDFTLFSLVLVVTKSRVIYFLSINKTYNLDQIYLKFFFLVSRFMRFKLHSYIVIEF